jgi:hypothetical protein
MPADSGTWIFSVKQMIVAHADPTQNPDTIKWMGTTTMSAAAGLGGVKKLGPSLTPAGLAILVSLLLITTIVIYRRRILS